MTDTIQPSAPSTYPVTELAALFEGLSELSSTGACDAALRCARDLFAPRHPAEAARRLRQRAVLLLAQSSDIRADRQAARREPAEIAKAQDDFEVRAREFLQDTQTFTRNVPVGYGEGRRARMLLDQAKSEIKAATAPKTKRGRPISIFVSYRRDDSREMTGFIAERLEQAFGEGGIFMDVDSIPFGVNFRAYIVSTLSKCRACLVVIGPEWIESSRPAGGRRIDDDNDLVRIEVETAIKVGVPVVPILIREAKVPLATQLPQSLADLPNRNGMAVRAHPDFENDMERLITRLQEQIA